MISITRFILQPKPQSLLIETNQQQKWQLSYEYLRVHSCIQASVAKPIANKKSITLNNIESLGKHGYRFIFSDGHVNIFDSELLANLAENFSQNWQQYLSLLNNKNLSREEAIDIVNLS